MIELKKFSRIYWIKLIGTLDLILDIDSTEYTGHTSYKLNALRYVGMVLIMGKCKVQQNDTTFRS